MASLENIWEQKLEAFDTLSKQEFDGLFREKRFVDGPLIASPSKWMKEFEPYDPHLWAFGRLDDNRLVCCDTYDV